jgi:DnaJ-class molecular chaperone
MSEDPQDERPFGGDEPDDICPECDGTGEVNDQLCKSCQGKGYVQHSK